MSGTLCLVRQVVPATHVYSSVCLYVFIPWRARSSEELGAQGESYFRERGRGRNRGLWESWQGRKEEEEGVFGTKVSYSTVLVNSLKAVDLEAERLH